MDKSNDILIDGIDERIEAFLRGQMNEKEEAAFKQEISMNPVLRKHVLAMTSLIKGLQNQNAAREKTIIKENTAKLRIRPVLWWACSIAAVFAIFFGDDNGLQDTVFLDGSSESLDGFLAKIATGLLFVTNDVG